MEQQENISDCRCLGCDEKISCNAKVCSKCGSFQNWRRYLNLGSTVISLLVAFISLIIVFISQLENLKTPDSDLTAFIINVVGPVKYGDGKDHARFDVYISNSGDRPGLIKSCFVQHMLKKEVVSCKFWNSTLTFDNRHGESRVVLSNMSKKVLIDCPIEKPSQEYSLVLDTVTHAGHVQKVVATNVRNTK